MYQRGPSTSFNSLTSQLGKLQKQPTSTTLTGDDNLYAPATVKLHKLDVAKATKLKHVDIAPNGGV